MNPRDTRLADRPALAALVGAVIQEWPEHERFILNGISSHDDRELGFLETAAREIQILTGAGAATHCRDYRWLCGEFLKEEIHFRRTGEYRLQSFAEATREVYDNTPFMSRYMNGVLVSQLYWPNHAKTIISFQRDFLPGCPARDRYLEIGPGHGLFAALAARHSAARQIDAWDVSRASLDQTRKCLAALGLSDRVNLGERDVQSALPAGELFDSIVVNEVLEHLDDPSVVLQQLYRLTAPGGRAFIGIPVNSPAPDHVYLLRHPEEVETMVLEAGFVKESSHAFPAAAYSLERALEATITVSCVVIATRPR